MKAQKILITGAAGFIGSSLSKKLIVGDYNVIGIDNFSSGYDKRFKKQNIKALLNSNHFTFYKTNILNENELYKIFKKTRPEIVIHLAALTGVRTSITKPELYEEVNTEGTRRVLTVAAKTNVRKFIFSSSSSVYGNKNTDSFKENQILSPLSPYAKSKRNAEIELAKLSIKYKLPTVVLRFFSVYGPLGRPDMAPYLFTEAAFTQKIITQFGRGNSARDYTFIDDVTDAIEKTIHTNYSWNIINIGNSHPIKLSNLIRQIEMFTNKSILIKKMPLNNIESFITFADITKAKKLLNWKPKFSIATGLKIFVSWYKQNRLISK